MFRKSALALAIAGIFATECAVALGLGDIDLKSALNQPFNAEVELLSATEDELEELKVMLGSGQAFSNAGIERTRFLSSFNFNVTQNDVGKPVIRITTSETVREPFLDFLLELKWSKGNLLREYTVLIDPPVTMPAEPVALQAPVVQAPAAPAPAPVRSAPSTVKPIASPPASVGSGEYGPTRRNDTLWKISEQVRPDTDVSMDQVMLGLLRDNPEAFTRNNINNLKSGYILRVPSREGMTSINKSQASREASAQHAAWRAARNAPVATQTVDTRPAATAATESVSQADTAAKTDTDNKTVSTDVSAGTVDGTEPKLQLVAPDLGEISSGTVGRTGDQSADVNSLKRELVLANEAIEAQRSQTREMAKRMSVLEEQIHNMQRLIQLKDDQLAGMQSRAATDASGVEAVVAETQDSSFGGSLTESIAETTGQVEAAASTVMEMEQAVPAVTPDAPETSESSSVTAEQTPETVEGEVDQTADQEPLASGFSFARIVETLRDNPLWLGIGAGLLTLLAFMGMRRKRNEDTEFQESILQGNEDEVSILDDNDAAKMAASSSLLSEFTVSEMASGQQQGETDPLAEADVYLAYGRFQQAEELLKEAMTAHPERDELHIKLLEVYQAGDNKSSFDAHAQTVLEKVGDRDHPLWQKIAEMGLVFNPGNPIYSTDSVTASSSLQEDADAGIMDFDSSAVPNLDDDEQGSVSFDPDLDMDLNTDLNTDMDIGADREESLVQEPVPEQEQASDDNSLDFDLGEFDVGDIASESVDEADEDAMEGDGELADLDEVSTKLDLARAYIDMGDREGARNILDEVIDEGNDDQKNEAQIILQRLAS